MYNIFETSEPFSVVNALKGEWCKSDCKSTQNTIRSVFWAALPPKKHR